MEVICVVQPVLKGRSSHFPEHERQPVDTILSAVVVAALPPYIFGAGWNRLRRLTGKDAPPWTKSEEAR